MLLSIKRVAPYVLMVFFASNCVLWWGWGPAVARGWATNSEFYIQRNMAGFSFILGLPIFTGVIMGDVVIRDFRLGVDPLIFSKPVGRASYVFGKFAGNFFNNHSQCKSCLRSQTLIDNRRAAPFVAVIRDSTLPRYSLDSAIYPTPCGGARFESR